MENKMSKISLLPGKRSAWAFLFTVLMFVAAIAILFSQEKRKIDAELETVIVSSLSIYIQHNAGNINRSVTDAERALRTAEVMLTGADPDEDIRKQLERRNENAPDYPTEYLSMKEIMSGTPLVSERDVKRLAKGETVVCVYFDEAAKEHYLLVAVPLENKNGLSGALYTYQKAENLLSDTSESGIYEHVQSAIIQGNGTIVYNTYRPDYRGNLLRGLRDRGFTPAEIDQVAAVISGPDMGSVAFERKGDYMFSIPLAYNGWRLVSSVYGSDVLLRSSDLFREVVVISFAAVFLTAGAAYVIFLHLRSSRKNLREEQELNHAYIQRFQAMFAQHTALMVIYEAATGKIVDANPALLRYFGYTRSEVMGQNVVETTFQPYVLERGMREPLSGELLFHAEPCRLKNGEIRLLDVHASVILDDGRKLFYAILTDVTDRERYREELWREKELLQITLQSIGESVVTTDNLGIITAMNSVTEEMSGWDSQSAVGKHFSDVFILKNEETGGAIKSPVQRVLETGAVIGPAGHAGLVNRSGNCIPIAGSAAPIKTEDGQVFGVVMVFRDVSCEKEHGRQIEFLSYHDSLTDLYNRRFMEEAIIRLYVERILPVSVIMADVNGLKITNDVFGHRIGDSLLVSVANLMRKSCDGTDLIARWGGDEFVILMPGKTLGDAEAIIHQIKNTHIEIEEISLSLSLSLGCACRDNPESSIQDALQQAEKNMYQQKLLDGKSYRSAVISALLATLHEKSDETEEHSKRLEVYCHGIGEKLRLSSREMDELSLLALLHDIGKVNIHPDILQKPGPLTQAEWVEMRRHTEIGYRIAQATPELAVIADLILSHHEHWDGNGYPRGLKGEEIPLACRILAVADAYDAMTTDRVYRKAMPVDQAIVKIRRDAGKQFDPQTAEILVEVIES